MNLIQKSCSCALVLLLCACGNKGDLFLEPVELTDEQKALLEDLDGRNNKKKKNETNGSE